MGIYDRSVGARSRQNEIRDIGLAGEEDLAVGFGERFSLANKITYERYTPVGRSSVFEDIYKKRDEILIANGLIAPGEELLTTKRITDRANSGNFPALQSNMLGRNIAGIEPGSTPDFVNFQQYLDQNRTNDQLLLEFIANNPELNIESDETIGSTVLMDQQALLNKDEDFADRSTHLGTVGYLTGSMIGWLRDPTHFASSLVGLSPVGRASAAANFFRVGTAEAAIVGAIELSEKSTEVRSRRRLGEPDLTDTDALIESGINIASAAVLGGAVGAFIGRFIRPIPQSRNSSNNAVNEASQEILDEFRRAESVNDIVDGFAQTQQGTATGTGTVFDPEVQQAANLLDETLQIARSAPENTSYETHMSNYAEARRNIAEGENVQIGVDDFNQVSRASDQEVVPPPLSETAQPDASIDVQNRAINTLRTSLEAQDVTVNQASATGDIRTTSSRELLAELDAEDAAVRATIDCLG